MEAVSNLTPQTTSEVTSEKVSRSQLYSTTEPKLLHAKADAPSSAKARPDSRPQLRPEPRPEPGNDPRWIATRNVIQSRHFIKSPLLSKFLLFVVEETLEGRQEAITEHQIGVRVFGRPESYRTVEDNIVRNYARQLRKRLAEHYAETDSAAMRVEIPIGGYVPVFISQTSSSPVFIPNQLPPGSTALSGDGAQAKVTDTIPNPKERAASSLGLRFAGMAVYSLLLIALTALVVFRWRGEETKEPAQALWQTLFAGPETTYVVPPDAGFNLVEDISHRNVPLAEYMHSSYQELPLPQLDEHSMTDLRSQQLTDFADIQLMVAISRLREYNPERVFLRFPRDLRLDDLKNANAILIGSVCSNPWAAVKDAHASFTIVCGDAMQGSAILNREPQSEEAPTYASHWNEPMHATYALISYLPNLSGTGHLLMLEGLDVAGTQAAAEALLNSAAIEPILQKAKRTDGSIAPLEILLKATSLQANATDTEVIASRIHITQAQ